MARPQKAGLDYFELDCHMDEKIELIEAEFGLKGFAVIVKLYQSIYSGFGYYCEWTPEISVLWAYRLGCTRSVDCRNVGSVCEECALPGFPNNLINEIVAASIRRNIFSGELFNKYRILTSSGIQKRYLNAVSRRERVELKKEYLLISVGKNHQNVVINSVNADRNPINEHGNTQSKEEKSREENYISCTPAERGTESLEEFFESVWKLYPIKKGKGQVSKTKKQKLQRIGYSQIRRCVERFVKDMESERRDKKYWMHGSTFFNSGYVDYLDENYGPGIVEKEPEPELVEEEIQDDEKYIDFGAMTDEEFAEFLQVQAERCL